MYKTEGIIIKQRNFKESDRLVFVYTPQFGKISFLAKGQKRAKNKLGKANIFSHVDLVLNKKRSIDTLSELKLIYDFSSLQENLEKTALAWYFVELIDRLTPERQKNYSLFEILKECFYSLEKEENKRNILQKYFEIKLLNDLGILPQFKKCVNCNKDLKIKKNFFSISRGGVVCFECSEVDLNAQEISNDAIKVLKFFENNNLDQVLKLNLEKKLLDEIDKHLGAHLKFATQKDFKSLKFLKDVEVMGNKNSKNG